MKVPTAVRFALALEEVGAEIERAFMEKGVLKMPELGKCPFCGGELKVEPFIYRLAELPKPIKLFGRWSLIKMRYREIPVKYSVDCENYCDGFTDYAPLGSGSTREEAIEDWNRKVNDVDLH